MSQKFAEFVGFDFQSGWFYFGGAAIMKPFVRFGGAPITFRETNLPSMRHGKYGFLGSQRLVLGGALLLGLFLPESVHPWVSRLLGIPYSGISDAILTSLAGSLVAILAGHISLNRFTSLPTVDAKTYIIPAFLAPYAGVVSGFFLFETPFGRYQCFVSLLIVIAWYYLMAVLQGRYASPRLAIIGDSDHTIIAEAAKVDWLVLDQPVLREPISAIVVDSRSQLTPAWEYFIANAVLAGIPVYDARHMSEALTRRVEIRHMADNSFGALLPASTYVRMKRLLDLLMVIPALPFVLAITGFFAVWIRLDSPGPALFRQPRMGFRGVPFVCYKLRSMKINSAGAHFTSENDDRITRIGAFIRKHRIDELPQVFNILKGEMSCIGPRPEAIELAQIYEQEIPFYIYRHAMRPGLSGWAAVHQGNVAEVDAATVKLQYDFFYIKYCSLWLDVLIGFMSLRTILTGHGSR